MEKELQLEFNPKFVDGQNEATFKFNNQIVMITPDMDEDNHIARVKLTDDVWVVIFPKFGLIGCGLYPELSWNTNLPVNCEVKELITHVADVVDKNGKRIGNKDWDWKVEDVKILVAKDGAEPESAYIESEGERYPVQEYFSIVEFERFSTAITMLKEVANKFNSGERFFFN